VGAGVNLLGRTQLATLVNGQPTRRCLSAAPRGQNNVLTFFLPYAVTMLYYLSCSHGFLCSTASQRRKTG
jgi:hypothetical protein